MKKWIFSMVMVFSFSLSSNSLQQMTEHHHSAAPGKFLAHQAEYLEPDSVRTNYLAVRSEKIIGFSGNSLNKLEMAFRALEIAVNSREFKDRVINFRNSRGERRFASNKGYSNEEIYELFMEGREILQPGTPGEMNFHLKLYYRPWSRVIGYTSGDTNLIHINWKFFKNYEPHEVASNLAHEWTHKMGFDHASAKEHDSAPYAIGYIVGDIASGLLKNNKLH
ncbi:MAG: hypothetical protein ACLGHN_07980 [Bacteriovoracia bacterium]